MRKMLCLAFIALLGVAASGCNGDSRRSEVRSVSGGAAKADCGCGAKRVSMSP